MTERQRKFSEEFLLDFNPFQAAVRAGYNPQSANAAGQLNLQKKEIQIFIKKELANRSSRTGATMERIMQELAKVAFLNPADVADLNSGRVKAGAAPEDVAAIAGVRVRQMSGEDWDGEEHEVMFADKLKALELLAKYCDLLAL